MPDEGRLEVSDSKRKGLRFRLSSKGNAVWMYEKRIRGGLKRKHTFEKWPTVSLADARARALELEAEAAQRIDRVAIAEEELLEAEAARAGQSTVQAVINVYNELHLSNLRTGDQCKSTIEMVLVNRLDSLIGELVSRDIQGRGRAALAGA